MVIPSVIEYNLGKQDHNPVAQEETESDQTRSHLNQIQERLSQIK